MAQFRDPSYLHFVLVRFAGFFEEVRELHRIAQVRVAQQFRDVVANVVGLARGLVLGCQYCWKSNWFRLYIRFLMNFGTCMNEKFFSRLFCNKRMSATFRFTMKLIGLVLIE